MLRAGGAGAINGALRPRLGEFATWIRKPFVVAGQSNGSAGGTTYLPEGTEREPAGEPVVLFASSRIVAGSGTLVRRPVAKRQEKRPTLCGLPLSQSFEHA